MHASSPAIVSSGNLLLRRHLIDTHCPISHQLSLITSLSAIVCVGAVARGLDIDLRRHFDISMRRRQEEKQEEEEEKQEEG